MARTEYRTYTITSSQGVDLGTYEGETATHAIVAMWRAMGYRDAFVDADGTARGGAGAPGGEHEDELTADGLTVREEAGGSLAHAIARNRARHAKREADYMASKAARIAKIKAQWDAEDAARKDGAK